MTSRAFVAGCAGTELSADERAFFRSTDPWGLILFARNCDEPDQIRSLVEDFKACVGRTNAPVLIDQEGGRVQRLKPPIWRAYPEAGRFGALYRSDPVAARQAVRSCTRLIAHDLTELGITVDCLPVLDIPQPGAHEVIGTRAYGTTPSQVADLARCAAEALLDGGVAPVIKHIPGHGRAMADSHKALPVVDAAVDELRAIDFPPFADLSDMPIAMTAHVVYAALDPDQPATQSSKVMNDVIRGELGFDGLVLTDDLGMNALSGSMEQRATRSLEAGCDIILHCSGILDEAKEVADATPELSGLPAKRAQRALERIGEPAKFDVDEAKSDLDRILRESV